MNVLLAGLYRTTFFIPPEGPLPPRSRTSPVVYKAVKKMYKMKRYLIIRKVQGKCRKNWEPYCEPFESLTIQQINTRA